MAGRAISSLTGSPGIAAYAAVGLHQADSVVHVYPEKVVGHREHRDHRGKTNGCNKIWIHLSGEPAKGRKT
jgi:hypothetical protein